MAHTENKLYYTSHCTTLHAYIDHFLSLPINVKYKYLKVKLILFVR